MTGIYLHLPVCASKCPYCDFYSLPAHPAQMDRYLTALLKEIDSVPAGTSADTVYFGGGTPILVGTGRLSAVLDRLRERFALSPDAEITLEANPFSFPEREYEALLALGFDRLSFGVQSTRENELNLLGRKQGPRLIRTALTRAKAAGFRNLSADLMLGIPEQTVDSLKESVDTLAAFDLQHLSAYLLKIEEGTPFAAANLDLADEDGQAELYLAAVELFEQAGYRQYEISNFARPGFESRHNVKYWTGEDYYGFGPAAHSFVGGVRFAHPRDLDGYIALSGNDRFVTDPAPDPLEERILLGLRLTKGIDLAEPLLAPHRDALASAAAPLVRGGLLRQEGSTLACTPRGFLVSNAVIVKLLEAIE